MGQNDHGNDSPDAGNTNIPQLPSQQLVGDSQPNYPSQPVGYPQPMNAPPLQPPKDSRQSWIIGCSVAAGVVIVLCVVMSYALFHKLYDPIVREQDAKASVQNFCQELESQDYVLAYDYLSTAAKGRIGTADQFMYQLATLDRSHGIVTSCAIDLDFLRDAAVDSDGKRIDVYVWVARENTTSDDPNWRGNSVKITLVHENNVWKVEDAVPTDILF